MEKLFENAPEIIREAAKSPLGLFALMILVLAILGFFFFREASERTRIAIFALMFTGVVSFGIAIFAVPPASEPMVPKGTIENLDKVNLTRRQVELEEKLRKMEKALEGKGEEEQPLPPQVQQTQEPQIQKFNISGGWQGNGGLSYTVYQNGNALTIREINPIFGITAVGQGVIIQKNIDISYTTAIGTTGRAILKVSDNGLQMIGTFTDMTTGVYMPAYLYR